MENSDFDRYKKKAIKNFEEARSLNLIDLAILDLLILINSLEDYYTTSSCSGRVSIDCIKGKGKLNHNWLFKKHNFFSFEEFKGIFNKIEKLNCDEVYLKFDNFILHVGARDVESAQKLLELSRSLGLKRSGIIQVRPRVILEIMGIDHLEMPLFKEKRFLINTEEDSLKVLYNLIINKLENNFLRLNKFKKALENEFFKRNHK